MKELQDKQLIEEMDNNYQNLLKQWEERKIKKVKIYQQIKNDFDLTLDKIFSKELETIINKIIENEYYQEFDYVTDAEIVNDFMNQLIYDIIETHKLNIVIPTMIHFPSHLIHLYNRYVDIYEVERVIVKYNHKLYAMEIIDVQYTGPFNQRFFIESLEDNVRSYIREDEDKTIANEFYETFVDVMEHYIIEIKEK